MVDSLLASSRSDKSRLRFLPAQNPKLLLSFNEPPLRERLNSDLVGSISGMNKPVRFGIIGGNGWLGNAIAQAVIASGAIEPSCLTLSGRSGSRDTAEIRGVHWTKDNGELV